MRSLFLASLVIGLVFAAACENSLAAPRLHESFDDSWSFHLGEVSDGFKPELDDSKWRKLDLPHDWSAEGEFSEAHASCTGFLPGGIGWYRKTFATDPAWKGRKVLVTFDGIYRNAEVWINGQSLGERPNGYITFQHDLSAFLTASGNNVLAVRVARENVADSRWYPGSGIYRHVWLTVNHPVHLPLWGNHVTTPRATAESADVVVETEIANDSTADQVVRAIWQLLKPDGTQFSELAESIRLAPGGRHLCSQWQKVASPALWSPDSPALYTVVSRIFVGAELVDETRTPFGIRTFYFDANQGFFLNGKNLKLKGLCLHHDGGVVGAAVPADLLARRLRLVKEIGGNAIRCSHNPMAPELYDLCDQLGLFVMDEAFDEWEIGKRKWVEGRNKGTANRFGYSADFAKWAERDCADMVRRGRNHPSIIMWSLGNEIDYPTDPYVLSETRTVEGFAQDPTLPQQTRLAVVAPKLIAAVKRWDATRPVTMALANAVSSDTTGLARMLDVVGYNYQEADYSKEHQAFPTRVIYGSENGRGFDQWKAVSENPFIPAQFLWVGFDFLGEAGEWPNHGSQAGLFDTRGFKKMAADQRQALWSDAPMVAVFSGLAGQAGERRSRRGRPESHWSWPESASRVTVMAFSNCEQVELRLNGKTLETKPVREDRSVTFEVVYQAGELTAVGLRDGKAAATDTLVTAGPAVALQLETDRKSLTADGSSVAHVVVSVVDAQGKPISLARDSVTVEVEGAGRLLGLDNGDLNDPTALFARTKSLRDGQALVLLQAGRTAGELRVRVTAPNLKPAELIVPVGR